MNETQTIILKNEINSLKHLLKGHELDLKSCQDKTETIKASIVSTKNMISELSQDLEETNE